MADGMKDHDIIPSGLDLWWGLYLKAYRQWLDRCAEVVDPRVWTHCKLIRHNFQLEQLECDGVIVGVFEVERINFTAVFRGRVIRKEDSPWRDPPVPGT